MAGCLRIFSKNSYNNFHESIAFFGKCAKGGEMLCFLCYP